jgi:hypothetical protein
MSCSEVTSPESRRWTRSATVAVRKSICEALTRESVMSESRTSMLRLYGRILNYSDRLLMTGERMDVGAGLGFSHAVGGSTSRMSGFLFLTCPQRCQRNAAKPSVDSSDLRSKFLLLMGILIDDDTVDKGKIGDLRSMAFKSGVNFIGFA